MNPESNYGRAVPEKVIVLPALTFDMLDGQPTPPGLGKTHAPVYPLPPLSFDMLSERALPVLRLTIAFRPDATKAQIDLDYHRLFALLNEHDLAHGGRGLRPVDAMRDRVAVNGEVQWVFRPTDPNNAGPQLEKLIGAIEKIIEQLPTIVRCAAVVSVHA